MNTRSTRWLWGSLMLFVFHAAASADGDPQRGARAFRHCAACHSLEPGRHLTGPSLAGVSGRAAGTAPGFTRYSEALANSALIWDAATLDQWLADPQSMVPGTSMRVPPIEDDETRQDIIAYLEGGEARADEPQSGGSGRGGMMAGMHGGAPLNLKEQTPTQAVKAITYCGDAYRITLGNGRTFTFWEFNLRFKTDSSVNGPPSGAPAIVRAGMMGDRAFVVFADPDEMSAFIRKECAPG